MNKPFFSVIIPAHNSAEYIRKGLDSIKGQDFADYELIVVCDACTDETEYVVNAYTLYTTHKKLYTEFGKAGMARNAGLDVAEGEWILFMDDDDWYMPGAFRKIAEELDKQKDIDILAYGFEWKGRGIAYNTPMRIYPAVWNKAWRREFIGENRFPDWIHTDDLGFARMMHPKARFGFLFEELYYYNFMRPGSVSERIRNGEYDNNDIPECARDAAIGYEKWLNSKEF